MIDRVALTLTHPLLNEISCDFMEDDIAPAFMPLPLAIYS